MNILSAQFVNGRVAIRHRELQSVLLGIYKSKYKYLLSKH